METRHFEPLRPNRSGNSGAEAYESTHGEQSVCVYGAESLDFVTEIPVGPHPDCHATSPDNRYLYIACHDGLYCIDQNTLTVAGILRADYLYAVNVLPDRETMLLHDQAGGVLVVRDIMDMKRIHIERRIQVIPGGTYRCEIGGKGNFTADGRHYLCNGWLQSNMYSFDTENNFSFEVFLPETPVMRGSDDLVISADRTKAYSACHRGKGQGHVAVTDLASRSIVRVIPTGNGTCGLTMTGDERYVIASNDQDDSVSVIDTQTDTVVNTPCAREGFAALGLTGYIQGISCGRDDSVYVYGCSGNGAIVRFFDVAEKNSYIISWKGGKYDARIR